MNKELYETAKRALCEADDDYSDDKIECGEIPDRAGEILKHKLDCQGQHVHWRAFWYEDDDADLDCALAETIDFCVKHPDITSYAVVAYELQDFVFVVYLTEKDENLDE